MPFPIPWRLIGYAAAALVLVLSLLWVGKRIRVSYQAEQERDTAVANLATYRNAVETAARVAAAQKAKDEAADAAMSTAMDRIRNDNDKLRGLIARLSSTVERTDAQGTHSLAVSANWWLCVSTAVSRDPTDTAACEANAGPSGVPDPISH